MAFRPKADPIWWPMAAGGLGALGLSPTHMWYLALPAFAFVIHQVVARKSLKVMFAGAMGYFCIALSWLISPFFVEPWTWGWAALPALAAMSAILSMFWVAGAWFALRSWAPLPALAVWLTLGEMGRGYLFTGFPWAGLGHVWISTPVAQLAAVVGPYGLAFLSLVVVTLLARARARPVLVAMGVILVAWGFGQYQLNQPMPADRAASLRLVQPNAAQDLKWDADQARIFFDRLLSMTAVKPSVDLTIWPETALPYLLDGDPVLGSMIAKAAGGGLVALGRQRADGVKGWNNLTVLDAKGTVQASYDKFHLVPFGEYIPFGDTLYHLFGIEDFSSETGAVYAAGPGPQTLNLGPALGRVRPLICYEAIFPQDLRGAERADWLLQITNDAWFGTLTGPWQHADQARLRAIEQGLPLVRVANTGVTAVYDARGRVVSALPFGIKSYLDVGLPGSLSVTPYVRWGDFPIFLLLGGAGLFFLWTKL